MLLFIYNIIFSIYIPNFGFSAISSILILIGIACCITIYGRYNILYSKNKDIIQIKNQESQLNLGELIILYTNRTLHHFLTIFIFCIFISKQNVLLYILCITNYVLTFINLLLLQNECPLSYLEKKILNKQYILNSNKAEQPYHIIVFGNKENAIKYKQSIQYRSIVFLILNSILVVRLYNHFSKNL